MTTAASDFGLGGLDELHAARNSQDASSQGSESEAWIGDEEGSINVHRGRHAEDVDKGVEDNEGLRKPALDISVPSGYTDPLRCLLAVPCPSPGACPHSSMDDRIISDLECPSLRPVGGRYARSESEPSEGPPLGRLAQRLDREYEQRRQHRPAAHLLCKDQGAPRGSEPSRAVDREL